MFFNKKKGAPPASVSPKSFSPVEELKHKIIKTDLPEYVSTQAMNELDKLEKTDPIAAEFSIAVNYIELLLSLPWFSHTTDNLDLNRAETVLNEHHYGLPLVKERVLEFLAAKTLKKQEKARILIVDDEEVARNNLQYFFEGQGYFVQSASNGREAITRVEQSLFFDILITDLKMDEMDGLTLIENVARISPETNIIMVTGYATVSTAVDAMRKGATHYLSKPVKLDDMKQTVEDVLQKKKKLELSRGPVLCFTGPPGTGKTSIGHAVATALGRKFVRLSMAGLRDEAEIRGHRRTYVGAMPGRVISEMKRAQTMNPCFLLDEIDKVGQDFRGDPASVLLEVLDPEQNASFTDHYLEIPFDLSGVMFIATSNNMEKLPGPLLDRLEIISFPSYSMQEKLVISKRYLLPKQMAENGLTSKQPDFSENAMAKLISDYTRESGVRGLSREIGTICRKLAHLYLRNKGEIALPDIDEKMITQLLGPRKYRKEVSEGQDTVGVVTSLVWTQFGGEIMFVEALKMPGSKNLILTGSLGEVLRESAQTALSYIRSNAVSLGIAEDFYEQSDIHIHLPAGAVSKDGPSAGVAIAIAVISLLTGRPVRRNVAITGEMTLTGRILPVGGIREKLLAAGTAGVTDVLLPHKNEEDIETLSEDVTGQLHIELVDAVDDQLINKVLV
ncbi:MAG: endopeptidase La [Desulfobulbaceae bacterium]|nr:endopeptidase La [Desulfobulbaceae bacterium]